MSVGKDTKIHVEKDTKIHEHTYEISIKIGVNLTFQCYNYFSQCHLSLNLNLTYDSPTYTS